MSLLHTQITLTAMTLSVRTKRNRFDGVSRLGSAHIVIVELIVHCRTRREADGELKEMCKSHCSVADDFLRLSSGSTSYLAQATRRVILLEPSTGCEKIQTQLAIDTRGSEVLL